MVGLGWPGNGHGRDVIDADTSFGFLILVDVKHYLSHDHITFSSASQPNLHFHLSEHFCGGDT
jgi:hypothetical protein